MNKIPFELVDIIIDYINYKKYHSRSFQKILVDINDIGSIFSKENNIPPNLVYKCWGNGWDEYYNSIMN